MLSPVLSRRKVLAAVTAWGVVGSGSFTQAAVRGKLEVYRDPGCGCCEAWVRHMQQAGFEVAISDDGEREARRAALGIPENLASCHTGVVNGIAVEGHVPAAEVVRLLQHPGDIIALAVPGMPLGSPGMETEGQLDAYEVIAVKRDGTIEVFARY